MTIREIIEAKKNTTKEIKAAKEEGKKNKIQLRAILKMASYCPKEKGKSWMHNPRGKKRNAEVSEKHLNQKRDVSSPV